jgi:hypothetical protein
MLCLCRSEVAVFEPYDGVYCCDPPYCPPDLGMEREARQLSPVSSWTVRSLCRVSPPSLKWQSTLSRAARYQMPVPVPVPAGGPLDFSMMFP